MKSSLYSLASVVLMFAAAPSMAQSPPTESQARSSNPARGIDIETLFAAVAKKADKVFIVDPRVRAVVGIQGMTIDKVGYPELLTILGVHGFAAVAEGNVVQIVPEAQVRALPIPTVTNNKQYADGEFVTKVMTLKSVAAVQLVPLLRPMLPQFAHLAAVNCTNTLVIVDRFSNVQRIAGIVESIDKGEPYKAPPCGVPEAKKE
jgi:general secretion pathway protein D